MTAGAQSIQPSLRSARAPSDSCRLEPPDVSLTASAPAATCELTVIGVFLPWLPANRLLGGGSRDQALRLQAVVELADHRLLRPRRADGSRRRYQVRDVDGYDLINRRLRPHARALQRRQDVGVERVVLEQRWVAVEAGDGRRDSADIGADELILRVAQAERRLECERLVLAVRADREVNPADRDLGRHAGRDLRVQ